jgi:protein gp37
MAENSHIEWCDHTFNPWMGCTRVSEGCKHCYAETMMDHRYGKVKWGPQGTRVRTVDQYWKQPLKWNKLVWVQCSVCNWRGLYDAEGLCPGCMHPMVRVMKTARQRVFCASLADIFEDHPQLANWRGELFQLIEQTPNLDWLILTKRPEKIFSLGTDAAGEIFDNWLMRQKNVWLGTSIEDQKTADKRIPELLKICAHVRFISCEPMLQKINLGPAVNEIEWVICGGESGPDARAMNPDWARSLRGQCQAAQVPFFFKQWGEWAPAEAFQISESSTFKHKPMDMNGTMMYRVGKGMAGRLLDGREWRDWPA